MKKTIEQLAEYIATTHKNPLILQDKNKTYNYNGDIFYSNIQGHIDSNFGKRTKVAKGYDTFHTICDLLKNKYNFYIHS